MRNDILTNRVALITGAARGLGYSYAKLLARAGATIIVNDILQNNNGEFEAEKVAEEINEMGGIAEACTESIADSTSVSEITKQIIKKYKRIDILIHNAGNIVPKQFLDHKQEDWKNVMDVHLNGTFYLLQNICPEMIKNNYGRIVLVTSSMGMFGAVNCSSYAASKMAIWGLTKSIDAEMAQYNVICNAISPLAKTDLTKEILQSSFYDEFTCEKVADIVLILCSDAAKRGGNIYLASNGVYSLIDIYQNDGKTINLEQGHFEEQIESINHSSSGKPIKSLMQMTKRIFKDAIKQKKYDKS